MKTVIFFVAFEIGFHSICYLDQIGDCEMTRILKVKEMFFSSRECSIQNRELYVFIKRALHSIT